MLRETPEFGIHLTSLMGRRIQTLRTRVEELLGEECAGQAGRTRSSRSRNSTASKTLKAC